MQNQADIQRTNEVLVKVEGLSKKFCKDLRTSLWYGVKDLVSGISGNKNERTLRPKEFWAVKEVSFELRRGECLGLIGHNGAGKSTLLKILNGLINPDAGIVTIKGRVGALIELGAGFNPLLSGRENIYNNGAVLGLSRNEIDQKLQAIIDFSELEEFMDMPVQHYSSGMKVRLGFAVAAQMEPDVLIIDEVLAVGDLGFMLKCFKTIDELLPSTAVIFVSHSMPMVSRICTQIILLDHGRVQFNGSEVGKAIDMYYSRFANNESNAVYDDGSLVLKEISLVDPRNVVEGLPQIEWKDDLIFKFDFQVLKKNSYSFGIILFDKEQRPVAILDKNNALEANNDKLVFTATHKNIQLSKGIYFVNIVVTSKVAGTPVLRHNNVLSFQVVHEEDIWQPFLLESEFKNLS